MYVKEELLADPEFNNYTANSKYLLLTIAERIDDCELKAAQFPEDNYARKNLLAWADGFKVSLASYRCYLPRQTGGHQANASSEMPLRDMQDLQA